VLGNFKGVVHVSIFKMVVVFYFFFFYWLGVNLDENVYRCDEEERRDHRSGVPSCHHHRHQHHHIVANPPRIREKCAHDNLSGNALRFGVLWLLLLLRCWTDGGNC
jgi:hypothetical protein